MLATAQHTARRGWMSVDGCEPSAAASGRLGEVTNGRFVEFQFAETGFG